MSAAPLPKRLETTLISSGCEVSSAILLHCQQCQNCQKIQIENHLRFAVCRDALKIAVSSRASGSNSCNFSFFTIPKSDKSSIQNTHSSASSVTIPILEIKSALDRAWQAER